ncbi:MAG: TonB-dependent receptor [Bacteroidetes bacterium]|nr:TonB-dependent receptor [Bacteroidota bacterium]
MKYPLFFILFLLLAPLQLLAKPGEVKGRVLDDAGSPIVVNIALFKAGGNTLVKADLTDEKGAFELTNIPDGNYVLKINATGFEVYTSDSFSFSGAVYVLPEIKLKRKNNNLKDVAVRAQKPLIEVKADKIVVNVENSIVNAGSSVLDVISRSPGVRVDQNDNISIKGRQGVNVMIDGKRQVIAGSDLANMLKSMPSSAVEQIEIISNPSAKYDAEGSSGIINIKTKRDKRMGLNGSATSSYAQGVYPKAGAGINLNFRDKKWSFTANYNYNYRTGFNHLILFRSFYGNGAFQNAYDQDNNTTFDVYTHTAGLSADYSISKKTTVGVMFNGSPGYFNINRKSYSQVLDSIRAIQSYFITDSKANNNFGNYSGNANLRHTFDSMGRMLTVDADYGHYNTQRSEEFVTHYIDKNGADYLPQYLLSSGLDKNTTIYAIKADYAHPMKRELKLEAGIKASYVIQDVDARFFDHSNGIYLFDSNKSNHFIYNENINAGYLNANKDWEKWSTQLGLRVEQTIAHGDQKVYAQVFDRNYTQFFPSVAIQRHLDKNNDLGISVSRRINRPNYEQLNPFKNFLDPSTYATGFPYILPELVYNIELSHTYKQRLVTTLFYSYLTDPITNVIQPSDDTTQKRVTVQTDRNLTSQVFYDLSGSYQFQFFKWWSNFTSFNFYYSEFKGNIANTNLNSSRVTADLNTTNSFMLPKDWSAELSFFYQTKQLHGYMLIEPQWSLSAGIQKNLFDKRATIKLNATDIFWRSYPRATSTYYNYNEKFIAQRETRQVSLSFTYRFGKRTVAPIRKRSGGAEDEKKRAGGSS